MRSQTPADQIQAKSFATLTIIPEFMLNTKPESQAIVPCVVYPPCVKRYKHFLVTVCHTSRYVYHD